MSEITWGLPHLAAGMTALASLAGVIFAFATTANSKSIKAMQGHLDSLGERITGLEDDNEKLKAESHALRVQLAASERKLNDYAVHVVKLELTLRNANIEPPEFEPSSYGANMV